MNCNVCQLNCPGDAIPKEHVVTHGIKRWLIDLEKCYPYSRLRDEYCHLCLDVCPYNVKSHAEIYKTFMRERKHVGLFYSRAEAENIVAELRKIPDKSACRYEIFDIVPVSASARPNKKWN